LKLIGSIITAKDIQRALIQEAIWGNRQIILPNTNQLIGESDLITVTNAKFAWEYEIKISRSDFFSDFKKVHRHYFDGKFHPQIEKHSILKGETPFPRDRMPRRFYFVVPEGMVRDSEVPKYCGLIYVKVMLGRMVLETYRTAPNLKHAGKLSDDVICAMKASIIHRYNRLLLSKDIPTDSDQEIS
jgi:hypothetical protein